MRNNPFYPRENTTGSVAVGADANSCVREFLYYFDACALGKNSFSLWSIMTQMNYPFITPWSPRHLLIHIFLFETRFSSTSFSLNKGRKQTYIDIKMLDLPLFLLIINLRHAYLAVTGVLK